MRLSPHRNNVKSRHVLISRLKLRIENGDFVLSGCRCVYFAQFWNRPNAVDVGKAVEIRNNLAFLRVEDHQLISIHVGDVKTAMSREDRKKLFHNFPAMTRPTQSWIGDSVHANT